MVNEICQQNDFCKIYEKQTGGVIGMERIRTLGRKIFCLNPVLTILIAFPSFVFVIYTLTCGEENTIMAYASYSLSAYANLCNGSVHFLCNHNCNHKCGKI